jgi:glucose-1-phosphate thymidylyltransferase
VNDQVIGLIPAAGKGLRLGLPYPKELYPVIRDNRYKPVSQFVLDSMVCAGVRHVVFVINETKHQLMSYFGDGHRFGCDISYVVQEIERTADASTSPGLAHALDSAYHLTRGKTVFFGMADTIMYPQDVFRRTCTAEQPDDDVLLALFETQRPEKFGMVQTDKDGRVIRIVDKPARTDLSEMWGCMTWRPRFTEHLRDCVKRKGLGDFAEIMNEAIAKGLVFRGVSITEGTYQDLGTYDEIMEFDRRFRLG